MWCIPGLHAPYDVLSILEVLLAEKECLPVLYTLYIIQASV